MSRHNSYDDDEGKANSSINFYRSQIIDKMAELIADYVEMVGEHPDFKEEMVLCWDDRYYVRVYQRIPMEFIAPSPVLNIAPSPILTIKKD